MEQCHSDSKVRWKSGTSVTVIVQSGGTMARSHGDSESVVQQWKSVKVSRNS